MSLYDVHLRFISLWATKLCKHSEWYCWGWPSGGAVCFMYKDINSNVCVLFQGAISIVVRTHICCEESLGWSCPYSSFPLSTLSTKRYIDTHHKAGAIVWRGMELATLPRNAMAEDGTFLTRCYLMLVLSV